MLTPFLSPVASLCVSVDGLADLPLCRWILADLERLADDDGVLTADVASLARVIHVSAEMLTTCLEVLEGASLVRRSGLHFHLLPVEDPDDEDLRRPPRRASSSVCAPLRAARAMARNDFPDREPDPLQSSSQPSSVSPEPVCAPVRAEQRDALLACSLEKDDDLEVFCREVRAAFAEATGKTRGLTASERAALREAYEGGALVDDYRWAIAIDQARGGVARSLSYFNRHLAWDVVQHRLTKGGSYEDFCRSHESAEVCARLSIAEAALNQWMADPASYEPEPMPTPQPIPKSALWTRYRDALAVELDDEALQASLDQLVLVSDSDDRLVLARAPGALDVTRWEHHFLRARDRLGIELEIRWEVAA